MDTIPMRTLIGVFRKKVFPHPIEFLLRQMQWIMYRGQKNYI